MPTRRKRPLRLGIELGLSVDRHAEMYGKGVAEENCRPRRAGLREHLFIVSKVLPTTPRKRRIEACERSLNGFKTDRIDLLPAALARLRAFRRTLAGFARCSANGKIRHHGVSNFGLATSRMGRAERRRDRRHQPDPL